MRESAALLPTKPFVVLDAAMVRTLAADTR
jgi:hypothetical protein